MALKVFNRFPGANVRLIKISTSNPEPELTFAADPLEGTLANWFYFRAEDREPVEPAAETLLLTLRFFEAFSADADPAPLRPVMREAGKNWFRLKAPAVTVLPDGQRSFSWTVPYPRQNTEYALCFPWFRDELSSLLSYCRGYWQEEEIGLTGAGRILSRLRNEIYEGCAACPHPRGLYIVARRQPGEVPASWVLDGMLGAIARAKPVNWCVWSLPFADLDGSLKGVTARVASGPEKELLRNDLLRWSTRCNPELILDLRAPDPSCNAGIRVGGIITDRDSDSVSKTAQTWVNVLHQSLLPDFATEPLSGSTEDESGWLPAELKEVPALTLTVPFAFSDKLILTPRQYREAGQRLARAIMQRR